MPAPVLELTIICMKYRCVRRQYNSSKCKECVYGKNKRDQFKSSPLGLPLTYSSLDSAVECANNSVS